MATHVGQVNETGGRVVLHPRDYFARRQHEGARRIGFAEAVLDRILSSVATWRCSAPVIFFGGAGN